MPRPSPSKSRTQLTSSSPTRTEPHTTPFSDLGEELRANWNRQNAGGSLFLLPEGLNSLSDLWQAMRQFELHPHVDPKANKPYLRAEGGAYGVGRWTNVPPHLKTFSRSLSETEGRAVQRHGEPLAWLWLTR